MIREYDTFADAYVDGLGELLDCGNRVEPVLDESSVGSAFGTKFRPTIELRPFVFRVRDPSACLIACHPRQPHLDFIVGQWLWTMAGSDDLAQIAYYNQAGRMFSEDGSRLAGAFGARMRRNAGDQLERVIKLLSHDPGSRRAVIAISEAADSRTSMLDFPCASSLHFMIRDGELEMITTMRSQSALMVLPYDAALFMMLQMWVAAELEVDIGTHTWIANSFHVYEDELSLAKKVRSDGAEPGRVPIVAESNPARLLERLQSFERKLRLRDQKQSICAPPPELDDPSEFHGSLAAVLFATATAHSSDPGVSAEGVNGLPVDWRRLWLPRARALS